MSAGVDAVFSNQLNVIEWVIYYLFYVLLGRFGWYADDRNTLSPRIGR